MLWVGNFTCNASSSLLIACASLVGVSIVWAFILWLGSRVPVLNCLVLPATRTVAVQGFIDSMESFSVCVMKQSRLLVRNTFDHCMESLVAIQWDLKKSQSHRVASRTFLCFLPSEDLVGSIRSAAGSRRCVEWFCMEKLCLILQ